MASKITKFFGPISGKGAPVEGEGPKRKSACDAAKLLPEVIEIESPVDKQVKFRRYDQSINLTRYTSLTSLSH